MRNKCLITGHLGFIGSHLMKVLGDKAIGYDIKNGDDILDDDFLDMAMARCNKVVHLAAISNIQDVNKNPNLAVRTNLVGTWNVLELAKRNHIKKVIVASSASTKQPELSLYGATKDGMEKLCALFDNCIIARFYNIYGEGSKSVVNKFLSAALHNKSVVLNGDTTRDYLYIDDLMVALTRLLENEDPPKVIEIGTGQPTSLKRLVDTIELVIEGDVNVVNGKPLKEIQYSSCEKPYYYRTSLYDGIKKLWQAIS